MRGIGITSAPLLDGPKNQDINARLLPEVMG
jgi:hypothetical protein